MSLLYHHAVDFFSVGFCPNPTSKYDYQLVQEDDDLTLGMRQKKPKVRKRRLPGKKAKNKNMYKKDAEEKRNKLWGENAKGRYFYIFLVLRSAG